MVITSSCDKDCPKELYYHPYFYINTLAERLPEGTINCMFADDVSVLAVENSLEEAQDACQKTVDVVVTWAKEWKLMLNA